MKAQKAANKIFGSFLLLYKISSRIPHKLGQDEFYGFFAAELIPQGYYPMQILKILQSTFREKNHQVFYGQYRLTSTSYQAQTVQPK